MIFDKTLQLSDAQAITATAVSTNVIDQGAPGTVKNASVPLKMDLGKGHRIPFLVQVVEAFTAAGAGTLTVQLQVDDNEAFASPKTVAVSATLALADLIAGAQIFLDYLPRGTDERYIRLNYVVATGPMTAGKVTAGVVAAVQSGPIY